MYVCLLSFIQIISKYCHKLSCNAAASLKGRWSMKQSLNNSAQPVSAIKGRKEEGIFNLPSLFGQMLFPGRSKSHTPVPVRIRTIYSNVLYEPRPTVGALSKLCGSASIWYKTAVPGGAFTQLTPLIAPAQRKQEPRKYLPLLT